MRTLVIIGLNSFGVRCVDVAIAMNRWESIILTEDTDAFMSKNSNLFNPFYNNECDFFIATKNCSVMHQLGGVNKCATLIHPSVELGNRVEIREGTIIFNDVYISPDVIIGKGAVIDANTVLGVDAFIGDYSIIGKKAIIMNDVHISSGVVIGNETIVEEKVSIAENECIGENRVVGKNGIIERSKCIIE